MAPLPVPAQFAGQTITNIERATWAKQAGFTGQDVVIAVAVSIAENGSGRVDVISPANSDGSHDYGMWQINDRAHADLFARWPEWWSVSNANMAFAVHQGGGGWNAWTTYKSGAYQAHMSDAKAAADVAPGSAGTNFGLFGAPVTNVNPITQLVDIVGTIGTAIGKAGEWMGQPHNWVRVALVGLGGALIIGAVGDTIKSGVTNAIGKVI